MNNEFFPNIYSILVLSHISLGTDKRRTYYYSAFFTKETPELLFENIQVRINEIYFKDLMIFSLDDSYTDEYEMLPSILGCVNTRLTFVKVKPKLFFSKKFFYKFETYLRDAPDTKIALLYKGLSLKTVKLAFKTIDIQMSGGNNTLKHILSPQQYLLSKIITILYGNNIDLVTKSFLDISKNKSLTRAIHDFTSEKDRLLLKELASQNKE